MLLVYGFDQAVCNPRLKQVWIKVQIHGSSLQGFEPNFENVYSHMYLIPW